MILSNISGDWWTFFLLIRQLWCTIEGIFSEVDWQFCELSSHVGSELWFWISGWDQRCLFRYSPMQKTLYSVETLNSASFSLLPILCINCKSPLHPSIFIWRNVCRFARIVLLRNCICMLVLHHKPLNSHIINTDFALIQLHQILHNSESMLTKHRVSFFNLLFLHL